jgi:DNA-binding beta-propeller fold protein YncE
MNSSIALVCTLVTTAPAQDKAAAPVAAKPAATVRHVLHTYEVGGDGGWDYLTIDPDSRRLYVSRSTHVMVIDADTGKVVGDIPDTAGVHGIAIAADLGRGFTSNGKAGTVTIFELATLTVIGTARTGDDPDAILYDAHTKRVFTFNGRSFDATAIDAATGEVVGTLKLGGRPEFAVADGTGRIFVDIKDTGEVVQLDALKLAEKTGDLAQNVIRDAPFSKLDLVACRNLLIYMDPVLQSKVVPLFHYSLNPDGVSAGQQLAAALPPGSVARMNM